MKLRRIVIMAIACSILLAGCNVTMQGNGGNGDQGVAANYEVEIAGLQAPDGSRALNDSHVAMVFIRIFSPDRKTMFTPRSGSKSYPGEDGAFFFNTDDLKSGTLRVSIEEDPTAAKYMLTKVVFVAYATDIYGNHLYSGHAIADALGGKVLIPMRLGYQVGGLASENWGPSGGFIFYEDTENQLYYEMAPYDVDSLAWATVGDGQPQPATNAQGEVIGDGKPNTYEICNLKTFTSSAASAAYNWSFHGYDNTVGGPINTSPKTYRGWFLPSTGEWAAIYQAIKVNNLNPDLQGYMLENALYWTSTADKDDATVAWAANPGFYPGIYMGKEDRLLKLRVRAIRTFPFALYPFGLEPPKDTPPVDPPPQS